MRTGLTCASIGILNVCESCLRSLPLPEAFLFLGVIVTPEPRVRPVTSKQAADRLDKAPSTIRYWVTHYGARRLGKVGKVMYYDFDDLRVIERELRHGHDVPPTPEERAEIADGCPRWLEERQAESELAA